MPVTIQVVRDAGSSGFTRIPAIDTVALIGFPDPSEIVGHFDIGDDGVSVYVRQCQYVSVRQAVEMVMWLGMEVEIVLHPGTEHDQAVHGQKDRRGPCPKFEA